MFSRLKKFWPLFLFIVLFFGIFYKIFLYGLFPYPGDLLVSWFFPYNSGGWIGYSPWTTHKDFIAADVVRQIFPWRNLAIEIFKSGQIPLWNPYAFSGYPLLANIQSAVFYPLNILFFIFDSKIAWIIYVLLQPILAFYFMYLFIRSISLSKFAAVFCSLSFAFTSYVAIWFELGVVGHSALWLPLVLFGITKYFKNKSHKYLILSTLALSCSIFAGHIQTTAYLAIVSFLYFLFYSFSSKENFLQKFKFFAGGIWFVILPLGICAIQLFPSIELLQFSARNVSESTNIFHMFQLPFSHLVTIFAPDFFGNPASGNHWLGDYGEFMGYFGITSLVFAFIGFFSIKENKKILFFFFLAISSLLFALPTPFSEIILILHIPILDTSSPARILFIFQTSAIILAGFAIDSFLFKNKVSLKSIITLLAIYAAIWGFVISAPHFTQFSNISNYLPIAKRNLIIPSIILITTIVLICIGLKNIKYKKILFLVFILLLSFEYQYSLYKYSPFSPIKYFFPDHPLIQYLQKETSPDRIYGYDIGRIETNLPTEWRLYSPEGYDALYIKRYGELLNADSQNKSLPRSDANLQKSLPINDSYTKKVLMNILDIKYIIYKDDLAPNTWSPQEWKFPEDRFNLIYQKYKWKVYKNKNIIPKATIFYNFIVEKDDKKIIDTLFSKNFQYQQQLILEESPKEALPKSNLSPTQTKILTYTPNKIEIETNAKNEGLLFLSDNYYPGWNAYIDNAPTKIYRTDYTFRSVEIKPGKHIVKFEYNPRSFIYGAIISFISVIIVILISLKLKPKKE